MTLVYLQEIKSNRSTLIEVFLMTPVSVRVYGIIL